MQFSKFYKFDEDYKDVLNTGKLKPAYELLKYLSKKYPQYETLIVGGAVRDIVLGKEPKDIDFSTNIPIEKLEEEFETIDIGQSKDFGIVSLKWGDEYYEVAQFREDSEDYSDSRRPDSVKIVDTFKDDSSRRDFTLNAMGINADGELVDYHGGLDDLKNKVLKTVGNPQKRFKEDALRILRAARFASRIGLDIEKETFEAMKELAFTLKNISKERIREELLKTAVDGEQLANYVETLDRAGILEQIIPELTALKGLPHNPEHHPEGGVWEHMLAVTRASPSNDPVTNLAVLFHDIGKGRTLDYKDGQPTYHGHESFGAKMFQDIANRLKFSNEERNAITFAIENHMKGHKIGEMGKKKVLGLRQDKNWQRLKDVMWSDESVRGDKFNPEEFNKKMDYVEKIYKDFGDREEFEKRMSQLIDGKMIMSVVQGIKGPDIGKVKDMVRDEIIKRDFNIDASEIKDLILKHSKHVGY